MPITRFTSRLLVDAHQFHCFLYILLFSEMLTIIVEPFNCYSNPVAVLLEKHVQNASKMHRLNFFVLPLCVSLKLLHFILTEMPTCMQSDCLQMFEMVSIWPPSVS